MENNKQHWRSRIEIIETDTLHDLQVEVNVFCKDKFVVGIQYPEQWNEGHPTAVISYKVLGSESSE